MANINECQVVHDCARLIVLVTAVLMAGCSAIPGLRTPAPIEIDGDNIDAVIGSARQLRSEYTRNVRILSQDIEDSAKFRLIDGTALAAASLFGGNRNVLSFFGIAGGASIAVDGTFSPSVQLGTYESGHAAVTCMVDHALAVKSSEPALQKFSLSRDQFVKRAETSLAVSANEILLVKDKEGVDVPIERIDPLKSVKNALSAHVEKGVQLVEASESVDVVEIFKSNLTSLDQSVRKKIRSTLKPQEATGIRDQLITQAAEAQAKREQAKQLETAIQALIFPQDDTFRGMNGLTSVLSAAARKATFDADLKKCAGNVGL